MNRISLGVAARGQTARNNYVNIHPTHHSLLPPHPHVLTLSYIYILNLLVCIKYSKCLFQFLGTVVIKMNCNNLALLWGEAQLCLPYVCLKKEK